MSREYVALKLVPFFYTPCVFNRVMVPPWHTGLSDTSKTSTNFPNLLPNLPRIPLAVFDVPKPRARSSFSSFPVRESQSDAGHTLTHLFARPPEATSLPPRFPSAAAASPLSAPTPPPAAAAPPPSPPLSVAALISPPAPPLTRHLRHP